MKLFIVAFFFPLLLLSQNDTIHLTSEGFNGITIKKTNIKDVLTQYGADPEIKKTEYTYAVAASHEVGIVPMTKTKTFYSYPNKGLVFITTENDIVSGIIFSKPLKVITDANLVLNRSTAGKVLSLKKDTDKNPFPFRNTFGFENKRYPGKTKRCLNLNNCDYCYTKGFLRRSSGRIIREIRIGE